MSFLIFDIETRVDKTLVRETQFAGAGLDDEAAYQRMRDTLRQESDGRSDFFPATYHVPISIALGSAGADYALQRVEVLGADTLGEAGIVRAFWERLEAFEGTLVSFNGRGFDLPVLELNALRHGCVAARYFGERNGLRQRFGRHCDLYDLLTNTGAVRLRGGLDLLAKLVGLPGKMGVAGGDVQALWEAGQFDVINRYCARDVIQTYFLLLRVEHMRGHLSPEQLQAVEAGAASFRAELDAGSAG